MQNKLYQLFISRLDGDNVKSPAYQERVFELVSKGIGGFIIFGGKIAEVKTFIDKIQSVSETPLFISSDIERGVGQQVKGCTKFPCQMAVSAAIRRDGQEDVLLLRDVIKAIAHEAIDVGINMPLIPVLDVNKNPDNPIICTRSFSDNPEDVSWFGSEYIKTLEGCGLTSCAKHFPGHGDTSIDSHISLPAITKSYRELMEVDVMPFVKAIEIGISSIMVGHLLIPVLDSMPASLSEKVIKNLLRERLGFDGLIITDALNMTALKGFDNIHTRCIKAGVDILLHPVDTDMAVKELENAIRLNEIDEESIESALERILKAKERLPHIKKLGTDFKSIPTLSALITDMSITLMKEMPGILPVTDGSVVLTGEKRFYNPDLWKGSFKPVSTIDDAASQYQGVTIIAVFSDVSAWRGSSGIGEMEKQRITAIIKNAKRSIVISFGSPYILSHFKDADMLIAAYEPTENAQRAVIRCLKRKIDFKGEAPVKLNLA